MPIPIDPSLTTIGSEWKIPSLDGPANGQSGGGGFGNALTQAISGLEQSQAQGDAAAQSLVNGTATDASSVVMQVERARLEMQLAAQIRTKAVEAYTDIFHTQV
jgi:flagellar hook-basal body complex protein FliE